MRHQAQAQIVVMGSNVDTDDSSFTGGSIDATRRQDPIWEHRQQRRTAVAGRREWEILCSEVGQWQRWQEWRDRHTWG